MAEFFFDLQRFATVADGQVTLTNDELDFTLDGVNYMSSTSPAVLKAETIDNGDGTYTATAITGIISGTVTAFPAGESTDPGINFVGDTAFDFTCTGDDEGVLNVKYRNTSIKYTSGNLTYSAAGLTMTKGTIGIGGTLLNFLPFNVELTVPSSGATLTFDTDGAKFNVSDTLGAKLTFDENIAAVIAGLDKSTLVNIAALAGITLTEEQAGTVLNIAVPIIQNGLSLDLSGTIDYNAEARSVLFEKNTTTNLYLNNSTISFTTDVDAGVTFAIENNALTITPQNGDGALDITIKNGDKITFAGNVEISGGSFIFDFLNSKISVTAGTTTTFTAPEDLVGKRSFTITADKETGFNLALDETGNKLTLTPADENPLHIQLKNGDAVILDRDVAITGSVVIGMDDNTISLTQGTALTFRGETGDSTITTTLTATDDAGITLAVDTDGKFTLTPGEDDGSLNITRKRDDTTTVFDFDLNVSGGSITFDPTGGKFTVAEGTTLEIINNQSGSYTSMAVEGGDASCTLTTNSDGTLALNVESGDGKLHFLHKHGDKTIFDNVLELSGKFTFDATDNTLTVADGTKLSAVFDGDRELTATVNGDANLTLNIDSGNIKLTPGENDGSIDLKLTDGDTTVFDGNLSVSGGGVSLELPTQTLTFDAGVAATVTIGDRAFTFSLPNGATQTIIIDDDGKINLTFKDSEPLHIKYTKGTTTILDADVTIDGTVTFDPSANSVSIAKGTKATVDFADGRTATFTALDDAGITASIDDDGKLRLAPNADNGEINMTLTNADGSTAINADAQLTGAIVLDPANQKIYAEAGTKLSISNNQVDIVTEISVTDDAGFTFAFDSDSGKVTITPEDGDGKLTFTRIRDGGERSFSADIEISGGSIIFDESNNSLTVTEGTTTAITVGDYTVELTVTDAAGITASIDDDGKFVVSAEEGDGELVFTLKKGDAVINTGSVEFDGTIELDPANQTLGLTKDSSATFTLGNYKYSITANADASITLLAKDGAITVTAPDGDGSLDIALTAGDQTVFAGNVEFTGSFTFDPVNKKISLSEDSQTKITVGNYTVSLAVTDAASVGFAIGNGTITLTATEGDGKATIDITKGDSSLLSGEVELDGEITLDVAGQKISVAKDTTLTLTRNEVTTSITATDDAGFTIANDGSKLTITPGTGDGTLQITRTQGTDTFSAELEINGSITYDTANNQLALTKGTTTTVTIGDYTVELTATDDAGVNIAIDGDKVTITPQDDDGSIHVEVTNGDNLIFENTAGIANGSITYDFVNQQLAIPAGTTLALEQGDADSEIYFTAKNDITLNIDRNDETNVNYFQLVNDAVSNITVVRDGNTLFSGNSTISGTFSYRADTRTFGIIGSDSRHTGDEESSFTLEIGDSTVYTFKAETNGNTVVTAFDVDDSGNITLSYPDDEHNSLVITAAKDGSEIFSGEVAVDGSIVYNTISNAVTVPADTITTVKSGDYSAVLMVTDDAGFTINAGSGKVTLTPGDGDGKLITTIFNSDDTAIFGGTVEVANGSIVFDGNKRTTSVTKGTTTTVTIGDYSISLTANDDAGVNIGLDGGKLKITPQDGDGSIDVVYSEGGEVAFKNNVEISGGSITFDATTDKVGLTKGTTITLSQFEGTDGDSVSVTALDDASIEISSAEGGGVRIAPDSGDGDLQLSVTRDGFTRTATLGIEGAVVYQRGGNISLEDGTTINLGWTNTEGVNIYNLKLTSNGSSGTIAFDAEKGLGVTSNDDKLDLEISSPFAKSSIKFEGIQGTLWYNSGKVTLTEGTSFKSTGIFQSDDVNVAFEAVDGDVYVEFHTNYFIYGAGTGTFKHTMTASDGTTGTININEGSLKVEHDTDGFTITEGSDITVTPPDETSDSILPFTTGAAGEYTINGHKLTTLTEGVQLIPTSNGMVLASNEDVTCDGLTFTGGGSVTLTADGGHIIGAGVSIADFDAGESFILTKAGSVNVDNKTFELTEDVEEGVTVTGAQDGYIIDSYSYGTEKFSVVGDDTYGVRLDSYGMDALVGIAADTTVDATATVDGEESYTQFDIVTEEEGKFTIGDNPYTISGDSSVAIWANFDTDKDTAFGFDSLNGTVSGDFAGEETFINYSTRTSSGNYILVQNDDDFKIVASANGTELHDISSGAILDYYGGVSKAYTDTTGDFTFGASDEGDDSIAVTFVGDDNVVFDFDSEQFITNIESVDGSLIFSRMDFEFAINGVGVTTDGEFSSIGAYNTENGGILFFHDVQDGSSISTDTPAMTWKEIVGENTTINGNALVLDGDDNGIWISDKTVVDLDEGASLTVSEAGDYTVNTAELTADSGDTFVGLENAADAYIYDENNKIITKKTSTAEIIDNFTHGFDYGTPITSQSAVKELLESGDRDQILALRLEDTLSADFSGNNGYKNITLGGEYAQSVKFNNQGYNVAVVDENARGKKEIFTGNGGDLVVIDDTKAQVSVAAGTGNDTIVSKGENVNISLSGGKNDLFTPAGNVTVAGYDAKTDSGFATSKKNIASAIEDGSIDFADGRLSLDSAKITFENTSEVVALYDRYGDKQLVGFTSQDDLLDARNYAENIIFVGNGNSTMLGGTGNDTILASGGDVVDGGAGRNLVKLPDERTPFDAGTDILLVNGDRDTVENFKAGFGNHDDRIYIDTTATPEFKFDGSNLSVTSGGNLRGILENVANNSDFVEFMAIDADGYNTKVAVAQENAFIVVDDELADLYYGKNSGVDFSNYTKMLNLDMDNDDGDGIVFYGINSVIAGSGLTTIVGTNGDDTLVAGSGGTRVWSNWGNDLMIGNNSAEKDKETEFFFLAGDGHDTIRNFEFFTTENAKTADKLQLIDNPVTDAFVTDSGDVFLKLEDDDDWLAIEGAQGKMLRVNDFIAKIDDKTVVFDSEVDYFVATGEVATLQVNESAEIWLDDDEDRAFAGDFRVIDATKSNGANTLAGNSDDNTIFGGQGDNSMWGGDGAEGDDVLYGGGGQNAFFYAIGNGSDTIRGANDGDDVVLFGISLDQIANAEISADSVEIQFTDGGSVRVEGTADVTYHLGDGSKFSADHNQGEWNAK